MNNITYSDLRFGLFILGLIIYAAAGSPTADHPSVIEIIIGMCLILSISPLFLTCSTTQIPVSGKILFLFGLSCPLIIGVMNGSNITVIFRDLIGLAFLCLPVFYLSLLNHEKRQKYFMYALLFIGLTFSVRTLAPVYGIMPIPEELLYLANSPLVLFTALYFCAMAFDKIYLGMSRANILNSILFTGLALLPLSAMLIDVQRISFFSVIMVLSVLFLRGFVKSPARIFFPVMVIILCAIMAEDHIIQTYTVIMEKTSNVGFNMRVEEFKMVITTISPNMFTAFFGMGWGAQFYSPAVGGVSVSFTHSVLSYMLLKTGLVGLTLTLFYLVQTGRHMMIKVTHDLPRWLPLVFPFLIPIFLYASHKSLDYGLILTLALLPVPRRTV